MKFDNITSSSAIGAEVFKIEIGFNGPETPYKESIIQQTNINGKITLFNLGTYQEKFAEFDIILLEKQEFLDIEKFFNDNIGLQIKVTEEFDDEAIFMENFSDVGVPYFASLIEIGDYAEDDFSGKRQTFRLRVKLAQPVDNVGDVFNPKDIGNLNALLEINTVQYDVKSLIEPDPNELDAFGNRLFNKGSRWLDLTISKIKEHSGANIIFPDSEDLSWTPQSNGQGFLTPLTTLTLFDSYVFTEGDTIELKAFTGIPEIIEGVYEISESFDLSGTTRIRLMNNDPGVPSTNVASAQGWEKILYDLPADISSLGYFEGVFYWAAFFKMEKDTFPLLNFDSDFIAGILNHKSLKIPGQSININNGPNIMVKEGFKFSINNADKFWKTIIDAGIPLFGAKVTLKIYRDTDGAQTLEKIISGTNISNTFSYTDYQFQIEPFLLNVQTDLPASRISNVTEKYKNIREDAVGTTPYLTYGEFDIASLQDISKIRADLQIGVFYSIDSEESITNRITGFIDPTNGAKIFINKKKPLVDADKISYLFSDDQLNNVNNNGGFTFKVLSDTNTPDDNIDNVKEISSVILVGDFYELVITNALTVLPIASGPNPPGSAEFIQIVITNTTYEFQYNESPSGGFGTSITSIEGVKEFIPGDIRLFYLAENNKDLTEIPPSEFTVNQPGKNIIRFNLSGINDPSVAVNFKRIGIVGGNQPLFFRFLPIPLPLGVVIRPVPFTDGSGAEIDTPSIFTDATDDFEVSPFFNANSAREFLTGFNSNFNRDPFAFGATDAFAGSPLQKLIRIAHHFTNRFDSNFPINTLNQRMEHFELGQYMLDNSRVMAFEFPVLHFAEIDNIILNDTKVVLGISMEYSARQENIVTTRHNVFPGSTGADSIRHIHEGMRLILRIRFKDGTFKNETNWEHNVDDSAMGFGSGDTDIKPEGIIIINSMPGEDEAGDNFQPGVQSPISNWDFTIDKFFATEFARDIAFGNAPEEFGAGTTVLLINEGRIDKLEYDGNTFTFNNGGIIASIPNNTIIKERRQIFPAGGGTGSSTIEIFRFNFTTSPFNQLVSLIIPTSIEKTKLTGRDLFDISSLFVGPTQLWPLVESIQFYFVAKDVANNWNDLTPGGTFQTYHRQTAFPLMELKNGPALFKIEEFAIEDRPLFSALRGKNLVGGVFPSSPTPIVIDIMETLFPGKTDLTSITNLMSFPTGAPRSTWKFRRQFIEAITSDNAMKELMDNLWSVIVVNEEDKFEFISLNPDDHEPTFSFTDANIIIDSITNPKFRKTSEIFQRFELNYDFNSVSDFSSSVPVWRNSNLMTSDAEVSDSSAEIAKFIADSEVLYNTPNTYIKNFKYHYDGNVLLLRDFVVKHFVFNSWIFKLKSNIDTILGPNKLKIMTFVRIKSFFHTDNEVIGGFITKIETNIHEALCTFTIFVPRPQGFLGPLVDPFKDAFVAGRVTADAIQNDAGVTGRLIGDFTQDDAGLSPRTL